MMSNLKDADPDNVRIRIPVKAIFENVTDEITLPKFMPA